MSTRKIIYIGVFLQEFSGSYKILSSNKIRPLSKENEGVKISSNYGEFPIIMEKPIYEINTLTKTKIYYFFDIKGQQLFFMESEEMRMVLAFADKIIRKHSLYDLVKASREDMSLKQLLPYIIGFLLGGAFIGYWFRDLGLANGWF